MDDLSLLDSVVSVFNKVKNAGYRAESLKEESYLGGDLGIDSVEMLEIWFDLERELGIAIEDAEKRDVYTLGQVLTLVRGKLGAKANV